MVFRRISNEKGADLPLLLIISAPHVSPFSADKGHLHHLLLKKGLSHSAAVKLLVCISGIIAAGALAIIDKAV